MYIYTCIYIINTHIICLLNFRKLFDLFASQGVIALTLPAVQQQHPGCRMGWNRMLLCLKAGRSLVNVGNVSWRDGILASQLLFNAFYLHNYITILISDVASWTNGGTC